LTFAPFAFGFSFAFVACAPDRGMPAVGLTLRTQPGTWLSRRDAQSTLAEPRTEHRVPKLEAVERR